MSYYLKYRPQNVSDLDMVSVKTSLEHLLAAGKFSHAYLFTGPKGTGKTSTARIIAKILNCEKNRQYLESRQHKNIQAKALLNPCGVCEGCISVQRGTNLSVIEMDAASNRGIDDIRLLKERINLAPSVGLFTVYVIDEVHMLTTEAFNALLKTLEEPPAHAVFVLCTTEGAKIPATVVSRCQVIAFTQATTDEIVHSLNKAVTGEGLQVDLEVLTVLASRSDGSFRDGMKYLEQAAQLDTNITAAVVDQVTHYHFDYETDSIIELLYTKDYELLMQKLAEKEKQGIDWSLWGERLISSLREKLYQQAQESTSSSRTVMRETVKLIKALHPAVLQIKYAPIPAVPLEVAMVEWCLQSKAEEPTIQTKKKESVDKKSGTINNPQKPKTLGKTIELEEVQAKWPEIMKLIKPLNHSLEALMRSAQPVATENDWLTIEVFYTFHKEQLEQERHRRIVEKTISQAIGDPVKVKFVLGKKALKAEKTMGPQVKNVTGSVDDEALARAAEEIFS